MRRGRPPGAKNKKREASPGIVDRMADRVLRLVPEELIDKADLMRQRERREEMINRAVANDSSFDNGSEDEVIDSRA